MPDSITVAASKLDADPMNVRKSYSAGEPDSPSPSNPLPARVFLLSKNWCASN
ncbi:hypothetical protein [Sinorhizobium medicae]